MILSILFFVQRGSEPKVPSKGSFGRIKTVLNTNNQTFRASSTLSWDAIEERECS